MSNPIDQLIAEIKEIRTESNRLTDEQAAFADRVKKLDDSVRATLNSSDTTDDDAMRLQEAVAEFVAESYKRTVSRMLGTRRQESQKAEFDAMLPPGGGFPRLS